MASDQNNGSVKNFNSDSELVTNTSQSSLSKYFGQPDSGEDVFSTIAKSDTQNESKVVFFRSEPAAESEKRNVNVIKNEPPPNKTSTPTVSFQKSEDTEPKIFSYFSKPEVENIPVKDPLGKDFFDLLGNKTSQNSSDNQINVSVKPVIVEPAVPVKCTKVDSLPVMPSGPAVNQMLYSDPNYDKCQKTWSYLEEVSSAWWIPTAATDNVLKSVAASAGNLTSDKTYLTTPVVSTDSELTDPLGELLRHYDGDAAAANRTVLTADSVTQDDRGIRHLIQAGFFRAAINLCGRLLTSYGQGYGRTGLVSKHTPHSLQLWFTRLALLVKTEQFGIAEAEAAAFGDLDSADLYFQFYPEFYGNKKGTMVPFGMRLLLAQLPSFVGKINEAQEKLHLVLSTVRKILQQTDTFVDDRFTPSDNEAAHRLWTNRQRTVLHCIINNAVMQKDYRTATSLLRERFKDPAESKGSILSVLGRVYLQYGDVKSAQVAFQQAADLRDKTKSSDAVANLVDSALVAIAQNSFSEALRFLEQALQLDPHNPLVINNKAVCLLYTGQMQQAMQYLEETVGTLPDVMLFDATVLNVCTLYELETSLTMQRKLGMLRLASQWRSDSFSVHNFKLQL